MSSVRFRSVDGKLGFGGFKKRDFLGAGGGGPKTRKKDHESKKKGGGVMKGAARGREEIIVDE